MQNSKEVEVSASKLIKTQDTFLNRLNENILSLSENQDCTAQKLAQEMQMSRTQLFEIVKKKTGITLGQYIQSIKVQRAHELLKMNVYNHTYEIATAAGFKKEDDLRRPYFAMYRRTFVIVFTELWGQRLRNKVLENIAKSDYTVEDLLHDMSLSRREFNKRVKRVTGLSPGRYIRQVKLQHAKSLIEDDTKDNYQSDDIRQVANAVGFKRVDYFSKLYNNYVEKDYIK